MQFMNKICRLSKTPAIIIQSPSPTEDHYPDQVRNVCTCLFFVYLSLFLLVYVKVAVNLKQLAILDEISQ